MKTKGNAKLKTTAEGLLEIAFRLANVIAHIARTWLYFMNWFWCAKLSMKFKQHPTYPICRYLCRMNTAYLLLGSNLQNPESQIHKAIEAINDEAGIITEQSSLYLTAAWGFEDQPDFLNQVVKLKTNLDPRSLIELLLSIEKHMGRLRSGKNAPRIIDIDILLYNQEIVDELGLTIPHPQMQTRRFVLEPLNEIAPKLEHPVLKKTIHKLLKECPDPLKVKRIKRG